MRRDWNMALWFLVIVAVALMMCPVFVMIEPILSQVALPSGSRTDWTLGLWALLSVGMLAGWATRWWPRTRSLGTITELVLGIVGSLVGGYLYVLWLESYYYPSVTAEFSPSVGYWSAPIAFVGGVLFVLLLRELFRSRTRY